MNRKQIFLEKLIESLNQGWSLTLSRKKAIEINKNNRIERIRLEKNIGNSLVSKLSERDLLIAGVSLYWAEGSKKETGAGFNFINSDPKMILLMNDWLKNIINIKKQE